MIKAWSYSRYNTYLQCPRKARLEYIDRIAQPPSKAMENGLRVHKLAESFILGDSDEVPPELIKHKDFFLAMRSRKGHPDLMVEGELAFRRDWSICGWFDADCWLRVKCDIVYEHEGDIHIVDVKTGSFKQYQAAGYLRQLSLYALALLVKDPSRRVLPRLLYVENGTDFPDDDSLVYTSEDIERLKKEWLERVNAMLTDTAFLATPNKLCNWCGYRKAAGGQCDAA